MSGGMSTIGTILKAGATTSNLAKLCKIKTYPQLGGAPENLETTDLEDTSQTFCQGVQSVDNMEFTANYSLTDYTTIKSSANTSQYYQIEFGESGADGKFQWQGTHDVYINSGDVNAVREMTIVCIPSTEVTKVS